MSNDDLLSRRPRTRLDLSDADMARLRDLYYDRDVPMTKIAAAFGLSTSTLYHWIAEMDWPRRSATFPIRTHPASLVPAQAPEGGAAPHPGPLPGSKSPVGDFDSQSADVGNSRHPSGERGAAGAEHTSQPLDPQKLALDVAVAARQELAHMGDVSGPMTLVERKRRADIIASLSRSIERIDKTFEARSEHEALKRLVKKQQDKIYALENAGTIEAQKLALTALKDELNRQR
jgi:transposase